MSERVSVLIRSSARPELADALGCVAAQTHRDIEVVIVNVTGRPHPPLPPAAAALNINFVDPGMQLPRPHAANAALDAATGDFLLFLDDDDLFDPDHVALTLAGARAHPSAIAFGGARICDVDGTVQAVWPANGFGRLEIMERIRMQPNTPLLPRHAVGDLRFDPGLPIFEDWDFWIRLSQRVAFRPLPHNTAICRLGLGTSGTGVGDNFDMARTTRESQAFHAKWEDARTALAAEFDALGAAADAAINAADWPEADALCRQAHGLKIWDARNLSRLARIAQGSGDRVRRHRFAAAAARAELLAPAPLSHAALSRLEGHLREGNARALRGDAAGAESQFFAALAIHEGDQTACNGLANLCIAGGRPAEAERFLQRGTRYGDRVYPTLVLKRGRLLEQLRRTDEARALYRQLLALAPRLAEARDRLRALDAIAAAA